MHLGQKIKERILLEGPITFETFMEMALYYPDAGYYTSESTEIGRAGDYYTSPHLHPIFGAMLGRQMEEMWQVMGKPSAFNVIEMGGGKGYLCKDMLEHLKNREIFNSLTYTIVELNPHMIKKQKDLLSEYPDRVVWVSCLSELRDLLAAPHVATGCILSNELLDSLPVHVIRMDKELKEIYISLKDDDFIETTGPLSTEEIKDYLREFSIDLPEGYRTEVNLRLKKWLKDACGILKEGFVLTIDYGYPTWEYYSEERTEGTLLCYYRHRFNENPCENIGRQDITSHVNFSALKKWGEDLGLSTIGFCRQGTYLVSLGIDEMIAGLYKTQGGQLHPSEMTKIKGLIMPGTMGDTHKIMIQYKGPLYKGSNQPVFRGFEMKNRIKTL